MLSGGLPGNRGGGRTKDSHLEFCRALLASPLCEQAVEAVVTNEDHPAFAAMYKTLREAAYGKPQQSIEHSGSVGAVIETAPKRILLPELDRPVGEPDPANVDDPEQGP